MFFRIAILLNFILIFSLNCTGSGFSLKERRAETSIEEQVVKISANDLLCEFIDDSEFANKFYNGKTIEISGIVLYTLHAIDRKPSNELGIGLIAISNNFSDWKEKDIFINCYFDSLNINKILEGSKIIVRGKYAFFLDSATRKGIFIKNSSVIEI